MKYQQIDQQVMEVGGSCKAIAAALEDLNSRVAELEARAQAQETIGLARLHADLDALEFPKGNTSITVPVPEVNGNA
jgi:hypothetical protein